MAVAMYVIQEHVNIRLKKIRQEIGNAVWKKEAKGWILTCV